MRNRKTIILFLKGKINSTHNEYKTDDVSNEVAISGKVPDKRHKDVGKNKSRNGFVCNFTV